MILNLNSQIIWVFVDLLILFVLMKKFLFGPITQMLDDRAQQVSDTLDQADKRLAEAEQQQTAHADEPAGSADQAAACDTLDRPPDSKADAVDQAVCRNSAQFFDKPAQRCQNPRIGAVRRGTYRCRAEFIPQTAEYRVWVRLPDTVKKSRDSALVVPLSLIHI